MTTTPPTPPVSAAAAAPVALACRDLHVTRDRTAILHGIDLAVDTGSWVSLVGPNGSGKTTLLFALAGLIPAAGHIEVDGLTPRRAGRRRVARTVAMMPQRPVVPEGVTARELIALGRTPHIGRVGVAARGPPPCHSDSAGVLLREAGPVRDDDPLLMAFTSGSSARPKAAVLTHASCFWTNLSLSRTVELDETDIVLSVLPQFHVGGWNIQPLLAWWTGATVVLERSFDPGRALCLIAEHGITTMMGVPTHYARLAEHPNFDRTDLSALRSAVVGGAPMPAPLLRIFHAHGVALTQGYGLTEAGPNVLCVPPREASERVGWAGVPYPHVEVQLVDTVTGEPLEGPGTGELLVRGPGMFSGYFRDEAATQAIWRNGWLATGDVATRDEAGYLKIVDRLRNIFISGGENVAPAEVEATLLTHPAVADVAVVGVPDDRWGEHGVALVIRRPGVVTDQAELIEHCRDRLAAFKVPAAVHFVTELPYNTMGKVSRQAALELALGTEQAEPDGGDAHDTPGQRTLDHRTTGPGPTRRHTTYGHRS